MCVCWGGGGLREGIPVIYSFMYRADYIIVFSTYMPDGNVRCI